MRCLDLHISETTLVVNLNFLAGVTKCSIALREVYFVVFHFTHY
jgi:hypothetical protein